MRPGTFLRSVIVIPHLLRWQRPGISIVDVGGFDGYLLSKTDRSSRRFVVDLDSAGFSDARAGGAYCIQASALNLAVQTSSVDVVLCLDLLNSLSPEAEEHCLREIRRVLRPGGRLILTDVESDFSLPFTSRDSVFRSWRVRRGSGSGAVKARCSAAGLRPIECEAYQGMLARLAYAALFYQTVLKRATRLRHGIWRCVCHVDRFMCISPRSFVIIAAAE